MKDNKIDLTLFKKTTHNPSYASLTDHFENTQKVKDYCIPVNNYFPPEHLMKGLNDKLAYAIKYYPSNNESITDDICAFAGVHDKNSVIAGNGSTEIISWLNSIFIKDSLMVPVPSFGRWVEEPLGLGIDVHTIQYRDKDNQHLSPQELVAAVKNQGSRNLVICNPNNPTGSLLSREDILWIINELPDLDNIIIDESFIDFSCEHPPSVKNDVAHLNNAWVLKSLGKNVGLHGLRMGFAISNHKNIQRLRKHMPYWNINGITELLLKVIKNETSTYHQSRLQTIEDTQYLAKQIKTLPQFKLFPTHSNFIFIKLDNQYDGTELRDRMLTHHGCFFRNCSNKLGSSQQYFRIASRKKQDVDYLISALQHQLQAMNPEAHYKRA